MLMPNNSGELSLIEISSRKQFHLFKVGHSFDKFLRFLEFISVNS
jgi:hypothetical protein